MAKNKKAAKIAKKNDKINKGHYVEVMDRLDGIMETLDGRVTSHPLIIKKFPKLINKKLNKALFLLSDVYQAVGKKC